MPDTKIPTIDLNLTTRENHKNIPLSLSKDPIKVQDFKNVQTTIEPPLVLRNVSIDSLVVRDGRIHKRGITK
jgi:hypothetical protein